jgi:tRNA(Ile)-lysidine synthase
MPSPGTAQAVCMALGVPLAVVPVQAGHAPGESPEDAARKARYRALAEAARSRGRAGACCWPSMPTTRSRRVLLALSRGAGLPGLAAMPAAFERHGMHFGRPLLAVSAAAIRGWLVDHQVAHVLDPTNADLAFTRNRIRHVLLPALADSFAQYRETFARSARHAARGPAAAGRSGRCRPAAMGGQPPAIQPLQAWQPRPGRPTCCGTGCARRTAPRPSSAQLAELLDQVQLPARPAGTKFASRWAAALSSGPATTSPTGPAES